MLLQAQINAQQQQQMAALVSASHPGSTVNSPPLKTDNLSALSTDSLQATQQILQDIALQNSQQAKINLHQGSTNFSLEGAKLPSRGSMNTSDYQDKWQGSPESEDTTLKCSPGDNQNIPGNVRDLQRHLMAMHGGRLSANSSFNKGSNTDKPLCHTHSFSDSNVGGEEFPNLVRNGAFVE